jgi:hypothetical protein
VICRRAGSPTYTHLLLRALERQCGVGFCPERGLVLSVITQAAVDLRANRIFAPEAREFLDDGRLALWCDLIGLDAVHARTCIDNWLSYDFEAVA